MLDITWQHEYVDEGALPEEPEIRRNLIKRIGKALSKRYIEEVDLHFI